ncbi:hypothetical protein T492DRAFT_1067474 [Pavlovales sp. CCMP2436]|nr:hypothetical protein T492DRAFT_1067474 [Pavlovales sp. CCMP2436]
MGNGFSGLLEHGRAHGGCAMLLELFHAETAVAPELRGISLAQLRTLVARATALCASEGWLADSGSALEPGSVTLDDLQRLLTGPAIKRAGRGEIAYAGLLARRPQPPSWYVVAPDRMCAVAMLAMLEQHALDRGLAGEAAVYWFAPLSLSVPERVTLAAGPAVAAKKPTADEPAYPPLIYNAEKALRVCVGVVALLDESGSLFKAGSTWPAYELFLAHAINESPMDEPPTQLLVDVYALLPEAVEEGSSEGSSESPGEVLEGSSQGAVGAGSSGEVREAGGRLQAVGLVDGFAMRDGGSAYAKSRRESRFPMQTLELAAAFSMKTLLSGAADTGAADTGAADAGAADTGAGLAAALTADAAGDGLNRGAGEREAIREDVEGREGRMGRGVVEATVAATLLTPLLGFLIEGATDQRGRYELSTTLRCVKDSCLSSLRICCVEPAAARPSKMLGDLLRGLLPRLSGAGAAGQNVKASGDTATGPQPKPLQKPLQKLLRLLQLRACQLRDSDVLKLARALTAAPSLLSAHSSKLIPSSELLRTASLSPNSLRAKSLSPNSAPTSLSTQRSLPLQRFISSQRSCSNSALTLLDLSENNLGDASAIALATALSALLEPAILDRGAAALAHALNSNETLTELSLFYNGVGDNGAVAFAEALRANHTLRSLDLFYNRISDFGASLVADSLLHNTALKTLDVRENPIEGVGNSRLVSAWRRSGRSSEGLYLATSGGLPVPALLVVRLASSDDANKSHH